MREKTYADYLTEQKSKEKLKDAAFVKCRDCLNLVRSHCKIWDNKPNINAPRICRHFKGVEK